MPPFFSTSKPASSGAQASRSVARPPQLSSQEEQDLSGFTCTLDRVGHRDLLQVLFSPVGLVFPVGTDGELSPILGWLPGDYGQNYNTMDVIQIVRNLKFRSGQKIIAVKRSARLTGCCNSKCVWMKDKMFLSKNYINHVSCSKMCCSQLDYKASSLVQVYKNFLCVYMCMHMHIKQGIYRKLFTYGLKIFSPCLSN